MLVLFLHVYDGKGCHLSLGQRELERLEAKSPALSLPQSQHPQLERYPPLDDMSSMPLTSSLSSRMRTLKHRGCADSITARFPTLRACCFHPVLLLASSFKGRKTISDKQVRNYFPKRHTRENGSEIKAADFLGLTHSFVSPQDPLWHCACISILQSRVSNERVKKS